MSLVRGENVLLQFYHDGVWKPYACARSCTFTTTTELVEVTVTGGGKNKHFKPTVNSFGGQCEGITSLGNAGLLTIYQLRQFQLGHVLQRSRFTRTADNSTSIYIDEVDFYITSVEDTSSFDNVSTFTIQLQGTGVIDQTIIDPPPTDSTLMRIEFTAAGGETSFTDPLLIDKYILAIHKDGIGNSKIITSGTPASKECKYTAATGTFTWAIAFEPLEEAYVIYRDL